MSKRDTGPVALVTGGAVRVGRAVVSMLAEHGYAVAIHVNRSVDEAEKFADDQAALVVNAPSSLRYNRLG